MARVDWSEFEQDKVVRATKELLERERVKLPMETPWKKGKSIMRAIDKAQVVLEQNRRRPIASSTSMAGIMPKLIAAGVIRKEDSAPATAAGVVAKVDPNLLRINQLADERDEAVKQRDDLLEQNKGLSQQILQMRRELQAIPTEANVVKNFVADILYLWDAKNKAVPGASHLPEVSQPPKSTEEPRPPKHDSEPRQEPGKRVHVVVVGGETMHPWLSNELKDLERFDLRLIETRTSNTPFGERLKSFKDPAYGSVILWTNYTSHAAEETLKYWNIPFMKYSGERGGMESLIRRIYNERSKA